MRVPVGGEVWVHYGQLFVESGEEDHAGLHEAFAGQVSGLCGAAVPGALLLTTGLHTGRVGFRVEVHDRAPELDPAWEDVVEVSLLPKPGRCSLVVWGEHDSHTLGLPATDHRLRYCAYGMDRGKELDTRGGGMPQVDRYLLLFWPAPPEPDRVIRQTSEIAAHWHGFAREQPPPPTAEERAEAERARFAEEEREQWGGRRPSPALRAVEGSARSLIDFDAALVHALDDAGPDIQRAVALLAARRACEVAGIDGLDWVAPALTALAEGRPLPPPFGDWEAMGEALDRDDPRVPDRTVVAAAPPPEAGAHREERPDAPALAGLRRLGPARPLAVHAEEEARARAYVQLREAIGLMAGGVHGTSDHRFSASHTALLAVERADAADPLRAALKALSAAVAVCGQGYPALLAEVRELCGGLSPEGP
ncbi:hypothetical protein [Streptomyces lichenis]|uniref:hypothetical protein n=1 Tax=Streptomyces lichenis TaxID=2306967 RepID=UPI0027E2437F|nr:hypothetical protein [Streptomyces lichenis]